MPELLQVAVQLNLHLERVERQTERKRIKGHTPAPSMAKR